MVLEEEVTFNVFKPLRHLDDEDDNVGDDTHDIMAKDIGGDHNNKASLIFYLP